MRVAPVIELDEQAHQTLLRWSRGRSTPVRLMQRAKIVLLAAQGKQNKEIAQELGVMERTVGRWRSRFAEHGVQGIAKDLPRGGRKPTKRAKHEQAIIRKTTQERPASATHWSTRSLAAELNVSPSMVQRVWKANGLQPHRIRTFKLSNDPNFEHKLLDVVGLYLNPPENALVFSADEKSQIQALDRTQPGLPIKRGRCGTMTHDYKRNGTTTLFAAIEMAQGRLISACMKRHRHQECLTFLKLIDKQTDDELDVHIIADNYATHKHPKVKAWLKRNPRFHMHFTPTSSSWLNVIEGFFSQLTQKRPKRGTFKNVRELTQAIDEFIDQYNNDPKPFVWTAAAEEIIEKVGRARLKLNNDPSA